MPQRSRLAFLALAGGTLMLAGCAWGGPSYAVLDQAPQPSDELPQSIVDGSDQIDPETARLLGEYDGVTLWLIRGVATSNMICLGAQATDDDWSVSCGSEGGELGAGGPAGKSYKVVPDGAPVNEDGATKLTENVYQVSSL